LRHSQQKLTYILYQLVFFNVVVKILIFYTVLFIFIPLFWDKKNYLIFSVLVVLLIIVSTILKIEINSHLPKLEGDLTSLLTWNVEFVSEIFVNTMPLPFSFAFYYAEKIILQQQAQRAIEQENFKLEQSIIDTQLNNLKNQINPNFLFRKLDYFYQESLPHSASLSKGISLLSDMMHYAIDDDDEEGKVPLEKEITHIRNFIEINQLRFDGRLQVDFEIVGEVGSLKIMPLILITFVENAFKYGELMDAQNPLKIRLQLKENKLFFSTYNRTRRGPKEQSEGIGMANTQKRLALGYPEQHRLEIRSEIDFYEVELEIELK
jgi:two-component system, LytTR family, sensor kinase